MITFRDFRPTDRADFLQMCRAFYTSDAVLHPIPDAYMERTFDVTVQGSPYSRGLIFEKDGEIAGYGLLSISYSNEAGGLVVWLEEIYVLPAYQGQGVGSAFFAFVRDEYRDTALRLRLEVAQDNVRAIKLYERMRFKRLDYVQMVLETIE